jgi:hypothetical protein
MGGVLSDRYMLIGLALAMVVVLSTLVVPSGGDHDEGLVGFADDIRDSSNGFVFDLHTTDDETIRCFFSEYPPTGVCIVNGRFSDDGRMLFIDSMEMLSSL